MSRRSGPGRSRRAGRAHRFGHALALLLLGLVLSAGAMAGERGYFGFAPEVSAGGFFLNPTVKRIAIHSVAPDSPAARGGIRAGDEVVDVEGVAVVGSKALKLRGLAEREVGQTLHLRLRHPDGTVYAVALVAVKRPG
jgi:predicted metalloprotease with PDZ domain